MLSRKRSGDETQPSGSFFGFECKISPYVGRSGRFGRGPGALFQMFDGSGLFVAQVLEQDVA